MPYQISDTQKSVTLKRNGEEIVRKFSSATTADEAIRSVAREFNLVSVNVEDADGNEITQSEGNKTLGETGDLFLTQKDVGA